MSLFTTIAQNSPLRVAIVDDEPLARRRLETLLRHCKPVELVGSADGCASGRRLISTERPEVVLLDVSMRDGTGFDLLQGLPTDLLPNVIIVTAHKEHALRAFRYEARDYLLKPVTAAQLDAAIERVLRLRGESGSGDREGDGPDAPRGQPYKSEFWIRERGVDQVRIAVDAIDWVEKQGNYACIRAGGRSHLLRMSLESLIETIDPAHFTRVHRSIIVRTERILRIKRTDSGARQALLTTGDIVPVGRRFARNLRWAQR